MNAKGRQVSFAAFGLLLGAAALSGCKQAVVSAGKAILTREAVQGRHSSANTSAPAPVSSTPLDQLKPVQSGPGLVIFDPIVDKADRRTGDFGAGCTRWLHIAVGGLPQMGKTPIWGAVDDARLELKADNLRLTNQQAQKVARKVGAPYFVASRITGNAAKSILSLQLCKATDSTPIGAALQATGSHDRIVAALPGLARQLTLRLKVKSPYLPKKTPTNPEELAYLGALPWKPRTELATPVVHRLEKIASRLPQAGILLWRSGALNTDARAQTATKLILSAAPRNTLLYCDIGWSGARFLTPHRKAFLALKKEYPNNYLLALTEACWYRISGDRANQRREIELAVRCAPRNPMAWTELSQSYCDEAQDLRRGRYAQKISSDEWRVLHELYPQELASAQIATTLDPSSAYGWYRVAYAATFNSDFDLADSALWKSLEINPAIPEAYDWGFQIYQPKWTGETQKILELAKFMAAHADKCKVPVETMISTLYEVGLEDEKAPLIAECYRRDPDNPEASYNMGTVFHYDKRQYRKAEQYYLRAMKVAPRYARPYTGLGDLYLFVKNDPKTAERLYRTAIELNSSDPLFFCNLARCVLKQGRTAEATKLAQKALEMDADTSHPVFSELGMNP